MTNYELKKRRVCSIAVQMPILRELFNFGLITRRKIVNLSNIELFVSLDYCQVSDRNFEIEITYIGKEHSLETKKFVGNEDCWILTFHKVLEELVEISKLYQARKRRYFWTILESLKEKAHLTKKGTLYRLYSRLNDYVNKVSVFGIMLEKCFWNRFEIAAISYKKDQDKLFTFRTTRNDKGALTLIKTKYFVIRDLDNLFGGDGGGGGGGLSMEDKDKHLRCLQSELNIPYEDSLSVKRSSIVQSIVNNFNELLSCNFFGFNIAFNVLVSNSVLAYQLSSLSTSEYWMEMSPLKSSPRCLAVLSKYLSGGVVFRTQVRAKTDGKIRLNNPNNLIKNIVHYDQNSAYANSFLNEKVCVGQTLHYYTADDGNVEMKLDNSMTCTFNEERMACFAVIWNLSCDKTLDICYTYHSFGINGQFVFGNYPIDLTITTKKKRNKETDFIYFINFHSNYFHGCDLCHTKSSKYKDGRTKDEIIFESKKKDDNIRAYIEQMFSPAEAKYLVIYLCHDFSPFIDGSNGKSYDKLLEFYKNMTHEQFQVFKKYINPPKTLRTKEVITSIKEDDSPLTELLKNAFYVAKVKIPEVNKSDDFGFIFTKRCSACSDVESSRGKVRHHYRSVLANQCYKYTGFNYQTLRWLVKERKAEIEDLTHVIFYTESSSYSKYVNKIVGLRFASINLDSVVVSKFWKNLINSLVGFYQTKSYKPKVNFRVMTELTRKISCDRVENCELLYTVNGTSYYLVRIKAKTISWSSFYFRQMPIGIAFSVLLHNKLTILKVFNVIDKFCLKSTMKLLEFNTDGFSYLTSKEDNLISSNVPTFLKKKFMEVVSPIYFDKGKKNYKNLGKMIPCEWTENKRFVYISANSRSSITFYDGDHKIKGKTSISEYENSFPLLESDDFPQLDRRLLEDGFNSVPF